MQSFELIVETNLNEIVRFRHIDLKIMRLDRNPGLCFKTSFKVISGLRSFDSNLTQQFDNCVTKLTSETSETTALAAELEAEQLNSKHRCGDEHQQLWQECELLKQRIDYLSC